MRFRTGHILAVCVLAIAVGIGLASGPRPAAATAASLSGIGAVSAGGGYTCALTTAGGVKCWGGTYGTSSGPQKCFTPDGTVACSTAPVDVSGLVTGVAAVSAGGAHTCAVTTAGSLKCWGFNDDGALGNGTTAGSDIPVDVTGLTSGVAAVSTGSYHTCALTVAGGVKCWGVSAFGELGNGTTTGPTPCSVQNPVTCNTVPVDVVGLTSGAAGVSAGVGHACALTVAGGVKCWGWNVYGMLGDGTTTDRSTPVDVSSLTSGVAAISAGNVHNCALTTAGGVKCWGGNYFGQLGDGTTTNRTTPVDVSGLTSGVVAIAAGGNDDTCALTMAGGLKCWGWNTAGQLGDGTTMNRTAPMDVYGLTSGVAAVSAGYGHTCALTVVGGVECWGSNAVGELGDGTTTYRLTPVDVVDAPVYPLGDVSCDGAIDAVDAAVVLQDTAGLLTSTLPCDQNADVNHDGQVNSLDALLVLQYSAGLLGTLPAG